MENQKSNTGFKIVLGIMTVLLVIAGAFAYKLYNQEKDTKLTLTKEKEVVLTDLKDMVSKYDVVIEENNLKDTELNDARDKIQSLIDDIGAKEATIASLGKYRAEVFKLREERDFLFSQNDSLRISNNFLAMRVDSTNYELEKQRGVGDSLTMENDKLAERVKLGEGLVVTKLKAIGVIERSSGKLIENSRARRVDKIRACYTVPQNRLAKVGDRELFVQVIAPSNEVLGENKKVFFENGESIIFSKISKFYYETTALDICENIAPTSSKFESGLYKINVYDGSNLLSQTSFTMK